MKPVFSSFNLKKSTSIIATALVLSLGFSTLQAAPIIEKIVNPSDEQVSVNYVGSTDNSVVFHLEFANKAGEKVP